MRRVMRSVGSILAILAIVIITGCERAPQEITAPKVGEPTSGPRPSDLNACEKISALE